MEWRPSLGGDASSSSWSPRVTSMGDSEPICVQATQTTSRLAQGEVGRRAPNRSQWQPDKSRWEPGEHSRWLDRKWKRVEPASRFLFIDCRNFYYRYPLRLPFGLAAQPRAQPAKMIYFDYVCFSFIESRFD